MCERRDMVRPLTEWKIGTRETDIAVLGSVRSCPVHGSVKTGLWKRRH